MDFSSWRTAERVCCLFAAGLLTAGCGDTGSSERGDPGAFRLDGGRADVSESRELGTDGESGDDPGRVSTTEGPVTGPAKAGADGIWQFLGIPYASPPTGQLRWRAPREPEPRDELLEADAFGPACPQPDGGGMSTDSGPTEEDCLTLNVWTPAPDEGQDVPVMVWFHGGGFVQGSSRVTLPGDTRLYSGTRLADRGVVVVTVNYRLGPLGFLAHPDLIGADPEYPAAGNFGFLDQVAALEWVRDNIANFGGNPEDVTIFGESAGGISVCGHLVAEASRGLFDRAIMQSGSCPANLRELNEPVGRMASAVEQGKRIAEKLGCEGRGMSCLRSKSTAEIFEKLDVTVQGDGEQFGPVVDGEVFETSFWESIAAGEGADLPLLAGMNADEGTIFARRFQGFSEQEYRDWVGQTFPNRSDGVLGQYPPEDYEEPWRAIAAILGDALFKCPTRWALRAHAADGSRAHGYLFSHVTPFGAQNDLGSYHSSELSFVFGNFARRDLPDDEFTLSDRMRTYWTQFAKDGEPGAAAGAAWPAYSAVDDRLLELKTPEPGSRTAYRKEFCEFWAQ